MNPIHHRVKQPMYHKNLIIIIILIRQTEPLIIVLLYFQILLFLRPLPMIRTHQHRIAQILLCTLVVHITRLLLRDIRILPTLRRCPPTHTRLLIMYIPLQRVIFHIKKIQLIHNITQTIFLNILQVQDLTYQEQMQSLYYLHQIRPTNIRFHQKLLFFCHIIVKNIFSPGRRGQDRIYLLIIS